ncbi:MAG: PAS domain S-box protein [Alphaproteobacteria bacterium]
MTDITADIVAAMRHPVLVLSGDLRVQRANPAFCDVFEVSAEETEGCLLYDLGNHQWDIPELRLLLTGLLKDRTEVIDYRVEHDFEQIGKRIMLLNARRMSQNGADFILLAIEDVTGRERERWELMAEKEFAEKIVDASREALLILDWDLHIKSANETFYDTFKVSREETEGRSLFELGNGEWNIPRLRELLENVLPRNNTFDDFVVEHEFANIGRRELILNGRKIDHKEWILLAIEDVTEREQSLRAQRVSEERFRLIVESARDYAIFTTDPQGRITGWYAGAENVFGWCAEEAVGRDCAFVFTPRDRERGMVSKELAMAKREGAAPDIRWHLRKDGRRVFIEGRVVAMRDPSGKLTGFLKIGQDITERRCAEQRLRRSEDRLRKVLETEAVGVLFFDDREHLIGANDAFRKLTGYSREEVESGTMTWRDFTPPEWTPVTEKQWEMLHRTGGIGPYEKEILHRDGSRSWMLLTGRSLGDGTIAEYCFDITGRKEAEEQRELLLAELNHRVKNTLAVVQGMASQTLARSRSLEEFKTAFQGRLAAVARGHGQLLRGEWKSADLGQVVGDAVSAFDPGRVRVRGPVTHISPKTALSLNMALHELETNSAKYGALSAKEGRVDINWTSMQDRMVHMTWRERGGPPVTMPEREGFGTRLIRQLIEYELNGEAELHFDPEGLCAEFTFQAHGESPDNVF